MTVDLRILIHDLSTPVTLTHNSCGYAHWFDLRFAGHEITIFVSPAESPKLFDYLSRLAAAMKEVSYEA